MNIIRSKPSSKVLPILLSSMAALAIAGCGDGGDSSGAADSNQEGSVTSSAQGDGNIGANTLTGVFIDSPVEGVSYLTESQSGTTNPAGEFDYLAGETVTFSIGDLVFPAVLAQSQISPVELAASSNIPADATANIARLLQSIDIDGDPDNGITVSSVAAASSGPLDFNVSSNEFANNSSVINFVANSGSATTGLISADDAVAHLEETLGVSITENGNQVTDGGTTTDPGLVINNWQDNAPAESMRGIIGPSNGSYYHDISGAKINFSFTNDASGTQVNGNRFTPSDGLCFTVSIDLSEATIEEFIDYDLSDLSNITKSVIAAPEVDMATATFRGLGFRSLSNYEYAALSGSEAGERKSGRQTFEPGFSSFVSSNGICFYGDSAEIDISDVSFNNLPNDFRMSFYPDY